VRVNCVLVALFFATATGLADEPDVTSDRRYNAVAWMQNAAEYRMSARQAFRLATLQLDKGLSDLSWTADLVQRDTGGYQSKTPAIILDVDETVLNNSAYSARGIVNEESYSTPTWTAWAAEEKAGAIPGALEFIQYARSKHVRVFYVTNRKDDVKQATINNLRALDFPASEDYILTCDASDGRPRDKISRRAFVAENHRILLLIGDNMGDFCADMDTTNQQERNELAAQREDMLGSRWIILPNAMYGGWDRALGNPRQSLHLATTDVRVTIATYNIRWLSSETTTCGGDIQVTDVRAQNDQYGSRLARLKEIVEKLDADIIGLQEIRDRKALELIFGTDGEWTIVIDDESNDCQDLAVAVRKPFTVVGASNGKLNAGPEHFLFEDESRTFFPGSRDVLDVEVKLPHGAGSLHVLVHHAKSRSGGRADTNERRVGAADRIVEKLRQRFQNKRYVLIGDFNDNPDDQSLNVLETGDSNAAARMEDETGEFLVNLTESLLQDEIVSHGRSWEDVEGQHINLVQTGSREENFATRDSNDYDPELDVLLDQILVPRNVHSLWVTGSVRVFNERVGVSGRGSARASDHLPVSADFAFPAN
jgi:acid phosphatase